MAKSTLTPYQRMQNILNPVIIPSPDFEIIWDREDGAVYVQCPEQRNAHELIEYVQGQKGGTWLIGIWTVIHNGIQIIQDNPVRNDRGWMWKLVKA